MALAMPDCEFHRPNKGTIKTRETDRPREIDITAPWCAHACSKVPREVAEAPGGHTNLTCLGERAKCMIPDKLADTEHTR